jgi:hypothetical protein
MTGEFTLEKEYLVCEMQQRLQAIKFKRERNVDLNVERDIY